MTDAVPPWWGEPWTRLEARWLRARRTGTLLVEASVGLGGDEFSRRLCDALLCLETEGERPCGRCAACRLGAVGTHPDFHGPADVATRYGIDDLRGWLVGLVRRPVVSARTVLWLPAADRLGLAAASALLKTLEEPPEDAVLILSARNARALPPTIRSRAEVYRLPFPDRNQGLVWLQDGASLGTGEGTHGMFLDLADGAPFLARRYETLIGGELERFAATVASFFASPPEALRAAHAVHAGSWGEGPAGDTPLLSGADAARVVNRWVRAALGKRQGLDTLIVPSVLGDRLQTLPARRLLDLDDELRRLVRFSGTGINEALAWEALALSCASPGATTRSDARPRPKAGFFA